MLRLQSDVPQWPADHKEPFKGEDSQGPEGHDPFGKQQEVSAVSYVVQQLPVRVSSKSWIFF